MNKNFAITIALLTGTACSLHAAAFVGSAYDGFAYPDNSQIASQTGGSGFNAAGDLSANTTTWGTPSGGSAVGGANPAFATNTLAGLSYGSLATSGGSALLFGQVTTAPSSGRLLGQDVDSGTVYFSFLMQKNNTTGRTLNFSLWGAATAGGTAAERFVIGQIAAANGTGNNSLGNFAINVTTSPTPSENVMHTSASPIALGNTTHLVVGKLTLDSSLTDTLAIYIDPTVGNPEPGSAYLTATAELQFLRGFRVFAGAGASTSGNGPVQGQFDEIRFGTTWDSVTPVPEPNAAALGLLASVLLLGLRRK